MNITSYDVIYRVRYYPWFHLTAVSLGTYYPRIGGLPVFLCSIAIENLVIAQVVIE